MGTVVGGEGGSEGPASPAGGRSVGSVTAAVKPVEFQGIRSGLGCGPCLPPKPASAAA